MSCSCLRYNLRMHWWITIYFGTNVVLIETMCINYILEYLNNLYFLFSHSWPVVVYNVGQVERKQNVIKKQRLGI